MTLVVLHPNTLPDDAWQRGRVVGFEFAALVFERGGSHGIEGGKISKLSLRDRRGTIVVCYDRGWDRRPKVWQFRRRVAVQQLLARFN